MNFPELFINMGMLFGTIFMPCENEKGKILTEVTSWPALQFPFDNSHSPINEILGSTHTGSLYNFTNEPILWEGANVLYNDLGSRVIKLWFTKHQFREAYSFNHDWPANIITLKQLAESDYFRHVFEMNFRTYILEADSRSEPYPPNPVGPKEIVHIEQSLYDLTKYLLQTYKGTGKIFILQSWEGDNFLNGISGGNRGDAINQTHIDGLIKWVNARQDGINRARSEVGMDNVYVFGAFEANIIVNRDGWWLNDKVKTVDVVVPYTYCDLYSWSNWEARNSSAYNITLKGLTYLKEKAPDSEYFGSNNIMLGEFGCQENMFSKSIYEQSIKDQIRAGMDAKCQFIIFWQLYDNVLLDKSVPVGTRPTNKQCEGAWLIRSDGTKSPIWDHIRSLFMTTGIGKGIYTDIKTYPNPVVDNLTLELPEAINISSITIYTTSGKAIYQSNTPEKGEIEINCKYFPNGIYIIKGVPKIGCIFTEKFIKE